MKVLYIVDPKVPISKYYTIGSTALSINLGIDILKKYSEEIERIDLLTYNDTESLTIGGLKIINIGDIKSRYQMRVAQRLYDLIDEYDIIHIHISTPGFVKYINDLPPEKQSKLVYTMHTGMHTLSTTYYYKSDFKTLVNHSNINLVFLTKEQSQDLLEDVEESEFFNPERVYIIPDAVNVESKSPKTGDYAIAVGRMVESKGILGIVDACIKAQQKLVLVSAPWRSTPKEMEYTNKVLTLIQSAPEGLIEFHESLDHDLLIKMIDNAKVGILNSSLEGFGLFVLECINLSTPILVRDVPSMKGTYNLLKDSGMKMFKNPKELIDLLIRRDYQDIKEFSIPEICTYESFLSNYFKVYSNMLKFSK